MKKGLGHIPGVSAAKDIANGVQGGQTEYDSATAILALLIRHGAHMDVRDRGYWGSSGASPVGILGDLWPKVLEGQGEDVQSARVPHLRCLTARVVLASGVDYKNRVSANVSSFIGKH